MEEKIILSYETEKLIEERVRSGCYLCNWIFHSYKEKGRIVDLSASNNEVTFPVSAQLKHIEYEKEAGKVRGCLS